MTVLHKAFTLILALAALASCTPPASQAPPTPPAFTERGFTAYCGQHLHEPPCP